MSSHHIVREKQEPALLVLGLDDFPDELLGQLLEWSPTVIVTADTADALVSRGIKIDWIITNGSDEIVQSDVKLMSTGEDNLTDAALKYLSENDYTAVNIVTDELKLSDYEHFANKIDLVIFNGGQKIYPVVNGFRKWKPAGEIIKLHGPVPGLAVQGIQHLAGESYKTTHDGFFCINFDGPFLFVAEEL
jgi:thiamine pyrophosphokinase